MSCKTTQPTTPILPSDLPVVTLTGNDNSDILALVVQDLRWRLRSLEVRWIVGVISEEEYQDASEKLLAILEALDGVTD